MHPRAMFERGSYNFWSPPGVLQCGPATQRGSKSYLVVAMLLRCGVHDHAALEHTCTQRRWQRGTDFRACTLRKARCHPTHGTTVIGGLSIAGAETCKQRWRGALLVCNTHDRDILAGVVVRRHPEAFCSNFPRVSPLGGGHTNVMSAAIRERAGAYKAVGNHPWTTPRTAEVDPATPATPAPCHLPRRCRRCR